MGGEVQKAPSIPSDLLQLPKQGRFSLVVQPVPGGAEGQHVEFRLKTVPVDL